jgi:hypothetical protein
MWKLVCLWILAASRAFADHGHVPTLLVSTDWGAQAVTEGNFDLSGGLTATVRRPMRHVIFYADARTLFVGGTFGIRGGMLLGLSYTVTYSETQVDSISTSYSPNASGGYTKTTTYSGTTTVYHGQNIRGVAGLALSASANTFGYGDGSSFQLEAGLGMCAQHCGELQYIQDVTNGGKGVRLAGTLAVGDRTAHGAMRYSIEALWGDDLPSFGLVTIGIGGGSGYRF